MSRKDFVIVIAVLGCIVVAFIIGKHNVDIPFDSKEKELQDKVRDAEVRDSIATAKYKTLSDSFRIINEAAAARDNQINIIKQVIRNEIRKTNNKIDAVPDSDVQRYVDSVRSGPGFH